MSQEPTRRRIRSKTKSSRTARRRTPVRHVEPVAHPGPALDPHHGAILAALGGPLDPEVFEACAAELLKKVYPTLTPLRGGSDRGRDGVVAPAGEPWFPLITTIGKDAKGNLQRNLREARRGRSKPTRAVFATSRRITPQARDALERAAETLGVRMMQVFDQDWFASELYRNPEWARRLLDVTGRPSALSVLPLSARPVVGTAVIGRDAELAAIRGMQGDTLLIGPPGSGKTYLLRELARNGEALFLSDSDRTALANAIRAQRPPAIIVDDAHIDPLLLLQLRQMRTELRATFRIVAVSWPADAMSVQTQLGVTSGAVVTLPDIDLDTMVHIVKSVGLEGPNQLIGAIVRQADGRAGLAATLADLCLRGDVEDVWTGESLARDLLPVLARLAGEDVAPLLACFALSGASGIEMEKVATHLGRALDKTRTALTRIGTVGVIRQDTSTRKVSVWPDPLRWVLVRDVFFADAATLDHSPLLNYVEDLREKAMTLLGAHARGAKVPGLLEHLIRAQSTDVWGAYASLGTKEARYVIREHRDIATKIPFPLLRHAPDAILPLMLTAAVGDDRALHSTPAHPLRQIEDWIRSPADSAEHHVDRVRALLEAVERWWREGGLDINAVGTVALRAACFGFEPNWHDVESDPGRGNTVTLRDGALGPATVQALRALWRQRRYLLTLGTHSAWRHVGELALDWRRAPPNVVLPEDLHTLRRKVSKEILQDLADASHQHVGVQREVRAIAHRLRYKVQTVPNVAFDTLFPVRESGADEEYEQWAREAKGLAPAWLKDGPAVGASSIAQFEREAAAMGVTWPRLSTTLFGAIAEVAQDPAAWLDALISAEVPADLVHIFLQRVASTDIEGAVPVLERCLSTPAYVWFAATTILSIASMPAALVTQALQKAEAFPQQFESWCRQGALSDEILDRVMTGKSGAMAGAASVGEWLSARHNKRPVRSSVLWREAILRSASVRGDRIDDGRAHWLAEIMKADPSIAFDWLSKVYGLGEEYPDYSVHRLAKKALLTLAPQQRLALLEHLDEKAATRISISTLVGNDPAVYAALLARSDLASQHLRPLAGAPSPQWREKAIAALNAGYSKEEVLDASRLRGWTWSGPLSDMWKQRRAAFDAFHTDPDSRIAAIAVEGSEQTQQEIDHQLKEEHHEAVHGRERRRR